ncbi:hypothetical protein FB451DRAFT_1285002 [Mycena latifolia]|nr:hypothetical protein FB451DRAFT_1285002 [Mycena latifolia]
MTVTFYGQPPDQQISTPPRSILLESFCTRVSATLVQSFFANRIRILSGSRYLMIPCFMLIVPSFIGSFVLVGKLWGSSSALILLKTQLQWETIAFLSLGPAIDILIASLMCFHLWRLRESETQFRRMRNTLDILILWTVGANSFLSCGSVIRFNLDFLVRNDLPFMTIHIIQSKLFSNSMLAVAGMSEPLAFDLPASSRQDDNHSAFTVSIARNDSNNLNQMP